ncbi:MAG: sigma-70 family RNA polymerase sigma factor [Kiritimatiellae bacterium]|nr:sigma-70 family RNA polymerase sigma factor [Kiritimatiellia bacterium]
MANVPDTSTTLLRDVAGSADNPRWSEFVARYRPMMEAFMRERFPSLEADDIIQETLVALCRVLPSYRYAPDEKGHFHNYLTGILRNKALRVLRNRERDEALRADYVDGSNLRGSGTLAASGRAVALRPPPDFTEDQSYRESLFELALRQFLADGSVADRTKRIFERTALNGESPEAVAAAFKMTRHAVDQAKSRAMDRLRKLVKALEDVTAP